MDPRSRIALNTSASARRGLAHRRQLSPRLLPIHQLHSHRELLRSQVPLPPAISQVPTHPISKPAETEHTTTGERRMWRGWAHYPGDSTVDPIDYLESEARKFPPDLRILATPGYGDPVRDVGHDTLMTRAGVLDRLAAHGIRITPSTWGAYTSRGHAPPPDRYVGRTPLWETATIDHWAQNRPGRGTRTDLNSPRTG